MGNLLPQDATVDFSGRAMPLQWVAWLCGQQLSLAGLCALAVWGPRTTSVRIVWAAAMLWFTLQAVDELIGGNFFGDGLWQYPLLLAVFALTLYFTRDENGPA